MHLRAPLPSPVLRHPLRLPPRCLHFPSPRFLAHPRREFRASAVHHADEANHYEVLGITSNASAAEIKKSFYHLSKKHHPDLHPTDPDASTRFVRLSDAYAVLSSPARRAAYDRTLPAASVASHIPRGSHSSHTAHRHHASPSSNPAGGRPASGLSRRRGTFRGPPPSFYRHGGYGAFAGRSAPGQSAAGGGGGGGGAPGSAGAGFGAAHASFDDDVPHFDRAGHTRTQQGVAGAQAASRRRRGMRMSGDGWEKRRRHEGAATSEVEGGAVDTLVNFTVVACVVALVTAFTALVARGGSDKAGKRDAGAR